MLCAALPFGAFVLPPLRAVSCVALLSVAGLALATGEFYDYASVVCLASRLVNTPPPHPLVDCLAFATGEIFCDG